MTSQPTLLDYYAARIAASLSVDFMKNSVSSQFLCKTAFDLAEAMLEERKKRIPVCVHEPQQELPQCLKYKKCSKCGALYDSDLQ
jgi:hypothetical protein